MWPVIASQPFGFCSDGGTRLAEGSPTIVDGRGRPRVILPNTLMAPTYGKKRIPLPRASFPFAWDRGIFQAYELPTSFRLAPERHDLEIELTVGDRVFSIHQQHLVGNVETPDEMSLAGRTAAWINRQIHVFQEIAHGGSDGTMGQLCSNGIRRTDWDTIRATWAGTSEDRAKMALIVRLARDRQLSTILESIARAPRRILERSRQLTRLDQIQQLDAACIRYYARQPGHSTAQKAGARQQLLAVQRLENRNTLENRVACWLIEEMSQLARRYLLENRHFRGSPKVRDVRRLLQSLAAWRDSESLVDVSSRILEHPVAPNYPLQFDSRYSKVYGAYMLVLRERDALDDAWEWQRVLWAESSRQLLGSILTNAWHPIARSCAYIQGESTYGRWTAAGIAPGPFDTEAGRCTLLDPWEILSPSDEAALNEWCPTWDMVGAAGADQVLWWEDERRMTVIWHHYWSGPAGELAGQMNMAREALAQLQEDAKRYRKTDVRFDGVLISPSLENEDLVVLEGTAAGALGPTVTTIQVPAFLEDPLAILEDQLRTTLLCQ